MTKYVKEFRYYGEGNPSNYPVGLTYTQLRSGSVFSKYAPITQLGIQGNPGSKFYINDSDTSVMLGSTGIYELDLEGIGRIYSLKFDSETLQEIINSNSSFMSNDVTGIIVDIVYEGADRT